MNTFNEYIKETSHQAIPQNETRRDRLVFKVLRQFFMQEPFRFQEAPNYTVLVRPVDYVAGKSELTVSVMNMSSYGNNQQISLRSPAINIGYLEKVLDDSNYAGRTLEEHILEVGFKADSDHNSMNNIADYIHILAERRSGHFEIYNTFEEEVKNGQDVKDAYYKAILSSMPLLHKQEKVIGTSFLLYLKANMDGVELTDDEWGSLL